MDDMKYTGYLFAKPTFFEGVASLADIFGSLLTFNYSETSNDADKKAMIADWYAICDDFKTAVKQYDK